MRRRLALLLMLMLVTVINSGCFGSRETDEIAYVLSIGIDQADEPGYYNFTYQIAVPRSLAGGPQAAGGKSDHSTVLVTLKAQSLAEGRNFLNSAVSRAPILSHTKIIILGEELARAGIGKVISPLMRFREFRGSMFVMVANNITAAKWMKTNIPKLELLSSRFYESNLLTSGESSYYLKTHLNDFYIELKMHNADPFTVLGGIAENPPPAKQAIPPARFDEYVGNTPRMSSSENLAEFVGCAIFRKDRMVGELTSNETRILALLRNDFKRSFFVVDDPLAPKYLVNVAVRLGEPVKKTVKFSDGRAIITIDVFLECEISAIPSGIQYEHDEYRQLLEEQISIVVKDGIERLMSKLQRLGCDTAGFGYKASRNFTTLPEWEAFDWYSAYQQAEVNVSVKTRIRRHGLLWKTSPVNKDL